MGKRRVLTELRLDKIAAVDRPCQEGATVAIIKRASDQDEPGIKKETSMTKEEMEAAIAKAKADNEAATKKAVEDAQLVIAKAFMSDEDEEDMKDECGDDEEKKKKFLLTPPAERAKARKAKRATDESLTVDGVTVLKSKVGDTLFGVLKAQQTTITKSAEDIAKANETAEMAVLEKRAADEYPNVQGTATEKALILKHAKAFPEPVRKSLEVILKSANDVKDGAFNRLGHGNGQTAIKKGQKPFEEKVAKIMAEQKVGKLTALKKAAEDFPAEYEAYQAAGQDNQAAA